MSFKTVYLTGAPAAGKSSTVQQLVLRVEPIEVWEYGARLTDFLKGRVAGLANQDELRSKSGMISSPEDIDALDEHLIRFVNANRSSSHLIIDSHPVTKEEYGFRVTAFSVERFRQLAPDEIWMFYTTPRITVDRIKKDPAGRPTVDLEQARMHTSLQATVALNYGVATGAPVYFFDTGGRQDDLVARLSVRLTSRTSIVDGSGH